MTLSAQGMLVGGHACFVLTRCNVMGAVLNLVLTSPSEDTTSSGSSSRPKLNVRVTGSSDIFKVCRVVWPALASCRRATKKWPLWGWFPIHTLFGSQSIDFNLSGIQLGRSNMSPASTSGLSPAIPILNDHMWYVLLDAPDAPSASSRTQPTYLISIGRPLISSSWTSP